MEIRTEDRLAIHELIALHGHQEQGHHSGHDRGHGQRDATDDQGRAGVDG